MPDPVPPPSPADSCSDTTKELKVLWHISLQRDTSNDIGSTGLSFGDKIGVVHGKKERILTTYDAVTGRVLWEHSISPNNFGDKDLAWGIWKDRVILHSSRNENILSQQNGQLIATASMPSNKIAQRMIIAGNSVYQDGGTDPFTDTVAYVMRLQLETLRWDTAYMLPRKAHSGKLGYVESPVLSFNASSDSILYFKFRTLDGLYFYAYNMTQKRVEWRKDSLDYDGSVYPPIVEDDRVYVDGLATIYCFDANTGQQLWSRYVGSRLVAGT
jgi:outer membrane protein assembly factor BamB